MPTTDRTSGRPRSGTRCRHGAAGSHRVFSGDLAFRVRRAVRPFWSSLGCFRRAAFVRLPRRGLSISVAIFLGCVGAFAHGTSARPGRGRSEWYDSTAKPACPVSSTGFAYPSPIFRNDQQPQYIPPKHPRHRHPIGVHGASMFNFRNVTKLPGKWAVPVVPNDRRPVRPSFCGSRGVPPAYP